MNKSARKPFSVLLLLTFAALLAEPMAAEEFKTVTDMRGVDVSIPEDPQRVVAISRSFIDTTMCIFGAEDKLVGGSVWTRDDGYGDYTSDGRTYISISKVLNPNYRNLTNTGGFGGPYGTVNVETIASLEPDILILRDFGNADEDVQKFLDSMEQLEIPVVVLKYPDCYDDINVSTIYEEVRLLGEVFNRQDKAEEIVDHMDAQVQLIRERTKDVDEADKPSVLYFGASSKAADSGGVGYVFGTDTIESVFLEDIVNAKNAYGDLGRGVLNGRIGTDIISTEQLLALDPDIIILPTYAGFYSPSEIYESEGFEKVQDLRAIKERRVYALTATPCKSERLEFPINLMIEAKAIYPERFEDIDLDEWIRDYFMGLYNVDEEKADELMDSLLLRYLEIA